MVSNIFVSVYPDSWGNDPILQMGCFNHQQVSPLNPWKMMGKGDVNFQGWTLKLPGSKYTPWAPKTYFFSFFLVSNLVFRWPRPSSFMLLGAKMAIRSRSWHVPPLCLDFGQADAVDMVVSVGKTQKTSGACRCFCCQMLIGFCVFSVKYISWKNHG